MLNLLEVIFCMKEDHHKDSQISIFFEISFGKLSIFGESTNKFGLDWRYTMLGKINDFLINYCEGFAFLTDDI